MKKLFAFLLLLLCLTSCQSQTNTSEGVFSSQSTSQTSSSQEQDDISEEESFDVVSEEPFSELISQEEVSDEPSSEFVSVEDSSEIVPAEPSSDETDSSSGEGYTEAEGFVLLTDVVPDIIIDVRYYSTYNFVGARIDGYEEPRILITKEAAEALKKVNDELLQKGYRLKVYDAYRPVMAVDHFVRWSKDLEDEKMKDYFYPDVEKSLLFKKGFIAVKSGHSRGSAVDLTIFCDATGKELDMGGTFDFFGDISYTYREEGLTEEQLENRTLLRETMKKYGFKPATNEWWHFNLKNEPYPDTYFNFPVNSDVVKR